MGKKRWSLLVALFAVGTMMFLGMSAQAHCGSCAADQKVEQVKEKPACCPNPDTPCDRCQMKKDGKKCCSSEGTEVKSCPIQQGDAKPACCPSKDTPCEKCTMKTDNKTSCSTEDSQVKSCAIEKTSCPMTGMKSDSMGMMDSKGVFEIGDKVADFSLQDAKTGKDVSLFSKAGSKATVLVFWNRTCPYVQDAQERIDDFNKKYTDQGVKVVAIDAGINNTPESIKKDAETKSFPILINDNSIVATHFGATKTPEVFVLDKDKVIQYHGAFDSGTVEGNESKIKTYAENAVKDLLAGEKPQVAKTKAFGCGIKFAGPTKMGSN